MTRAAGNDFYFPFYCFFYRSYEFYFWFNYIIVCHVSSFWFNFVCVWLSELRFLYESICDIILLLLTSHGITQHKMNPFHFFYECICLWTWNDRKSCMTFNDWYWLKKRVVLVWNVFEQRYLQIPVRNCSYKNEH